MADKVRYSINAIPIEEVTKAVTYSSEEEGSVLIDTSDSAHEVIATEVGKSFGGSGEAPVNDYSSNAGDQGWKNRTVNYANAVDDSYTALGGHTSASFVFIKNTGYLFSSTTALGDAAPSTGDHVEVAVNNGAITIAFLGPGECIALKALQATKTLDATDIKIKSFEDDGTAAGGSDHIAVEFFIVD
tara:strand:+ start:2125 stop:2685 length:561 start_codon:yes stop_codon:yes gene_type:complete